MRRLAPHSIFYVSSLWGLPRRLSPHCLSLRLNCLLPCVLPCLLAWTLFAVGSLAWGESGFTSGFTLAPYSELPASVVAELSPKPLPPTMSVAVQQAQKLWQHYQTYEAAYDSALARVYAPTASIQIQHQLANSSQPITEIIPAGQYQQSIRQLMPVAKASGDCSLYENVRFIEKGAWVIVQATRVDGRGGYRVPHWLTILPDANNPLGGAVVAEVAVIQEAQ